VRVVEHSVLRKGKEASKKFTYQGLTTFTEVDRIRTIISSAYNHVRSKRGEDERSMAMFIREEAVRSGGVPYTNVEGAASSTSSTLGDTAARTVGGCGSSLLPKCRQRNSPVQGERARTNCLLVGWLDEEGREECERAIQTRQDWVVWSRARPMKGNCTSRGFEQMGKTVFCGKADRNKKEQGDPESEEGIEDETSNSDVNPSGRARRQKGWWKRGVMETKLNTVNMTAWVHQECDVMDENALLKLQGAWDNPQQKDECSVRMDDLEWVYWMGTEVRQLGGYGFQGAIF